MTRGGAKNIPFAGAAAAAALVLSLLLCLSSLGATSPTYDEPAYIDAARKVTGGLRFEALSTILHPPLTFFINGFLIRWAPAGSFQGDLAAARIADLLIFLTAAAVLVYAWSREIFGRWPAALSVLLFALCPIVMAHARLATTDIAAGCTFFAAFYALWKLFQNPSLIRTAAAGLVLGCTLLAKYSTVLAAPIAAVVLAAAVVVARQERRQGAVLARSAALAACTAGAFVIALLCLAAAYGFTGMFEPRPAAMFQSSFFTALARTPVLGGLLSLLPEPYLLGLDYQKQITETGFTSFILGDKHYHGVWYYYPIGFLSKMPLPFMALLALGAWQLRRRGARFGRLFLIAPPALFFLYLIAANSSNAGVRYAMPAIPFLAVIAGGAASTGAGGAASTGAGGAASTAGVAGAEHGKKATRWARAGVIGVLCAWFAGGTLLVHPYYLAYQNEAFGGPDNAYKIMAGSDLDWGQDTGAAETFWRSLEDTEKKSLIPGILPVTGTILINANELNDCLRPRDRHAWLRLFEPDGNIGYTHLIYYLSLDDFRSAAADRPDDPTACYALAGALLAEGRLDDCRRELERGLKKTPGSALLHFLEGVLLSRVKDRERAVQALLQAADLDPTIMEAYAPARFLLLRAGRQDVADSVRRSQIMAEIRMSHLDGFPEDAAALAQRAAEGAASAADLCTLSVLAWIDGDLDRAVEHARAAAAEDPLNAQALGNLLFLLVERSPVASYQEALNIGRTIEDLWISARVHMAPTVMYSGGRIVFGRVLTFPVVTRAEVEARYVLQHLREEKEPPGGVERIAALIDELIGRQNLPVAQELWIAARDRFPDDRELNRLKFVLDNHERQLW